MMGPERIRGRPDGTAGFTLVELMVAVVLLAIGVLGLAGTTGYVVRTVSLADLRTERAAALQSAVEQVKALPFDSIATGSDSVGVFAVSWTTLTTTNWQKEVRFITVGPGFLTTSNAAGTVVSSQVADTFDFSVTRP